MRNLIAIFTLCIVSCNTMNKRANPEYYFEGKYLEIGIAIFENDKAALISALSRNHLDINEVGKGGKYGKPTFLMYAVMIESEGMVQLLLENGANANQDSDLIFDNMKLKDKDGNEILYTRDNPLNWATQSIKNDKAYNIIALLIKHDADINAFGEYYSSALLNTLVSHDGTKMFDFLIEAGANINAYGDKMGNTALTTAASTGDRSRLIHILDKGADPKVLTFSGWDIMYEVGEALTSGPAKNKAFYEELKNRLVNQYGMNYPAVRDKVKGAALRDSAYKANMLKVNRLTE